MMNTTLKKKKIPTEPPRGLQRIFIIPKDLDSKLKKESYESGRSRSDIVREALYVYFTNK